MGRSYTSCPECGNALLTKKYESRYGRCKACYDREHMPLDARIARALRR